MLGDRPVSAINGPSCDPSEALALNIRTSTTGAGQDTGSGTTWLISALPRLLSGEGVISRSATGRGLPPEPPHTRIAATIMTGPTVPIRLAGEPGPKSRPWTCTRTWPLEETDASPSPMTQGRPPLVTPPIIRPGTEP